MVGIGTFHIELMGIFHIELMGTFHIELMGTFHIELTFALRFAYTQCCASSRHDLLGKSHLHSGASMPWQSREQIVVTVHFATRPAGIQDTGTARANNASYKSRNHDRPPRQWSERMSR